MTELKLDVEICEMDFGRYSWSRYEAFKVRTGNDGKVLTNDYNLNKVAQFQGVKVLNINELANSIKPLVISRRDASYYCKRR